MPAPHWRQSSRRPASSRPTWWRPHLRRRPGRLPAPTR
jgi:hypothetical protein